MRFIGADMRPNKSILAAALLTAGGLSSAYGGGCEELSQMAVDIREDYRNLGELKADLRVERARLQGLEGVGVASLFGDIRKKEIVGGELFTNTFAGLKGKKLYEKFLKLCADEEREGEERAAKQAARAAKRNANKGLAEDKP